MCTAMGDFDIKSTHYYGYIKTKILITCKQYIQCQSKYSHASDLSSLSQCILLHIAYNSLSLIHSQILLENTVTIILPCLLDLCCKGCNNSYCICQKSLQIMFHRNIIEDVPVNIFNLTCHHEIFSTSFLLQNLQCFAIYLFTVWEIFGSHQQLHTLSYTFIYLFLEEKIIVPCKQGLSYTY